ncbi:MAG: Rrf2 family transcriptional regulator [Alphaproteobacteria bacterium]|nr:Rrf2 family transcriptional regulator [Alphaproteobacteria bacterium]
MLRLSKKMMLALEAVVDIAVNARPDPVQSKEITDRQGIPQRYLEQIMQALVHAGILKGVRGPRGGYRLAKERRRITVAEVVHVVAELEASSEPPLTQTSPIGEKVVKPMIERFHHELMERLSTVTIEDLCNEVQAAAIPATAKSMDFTI